MAIDENQITITSSLPNYINMIAGGIRIIIKPGATVLSETGNMLFNNSDHDIITQSSGISLYASCIHIAEMEPPRSEDEVAPLAGCGIEPPYYIEA